jgi:hypothetical protein
MANDLHGQGMKLIISSTSFKSTLVTARYSSFQSSNDSLNFCLRYLDRSQ